MSSLIEVLAEMEGKPETKNENEISGEKSNQEAKADYGKLDMTLVPTNIIRAIAVIRHFGNKKYGSPDNWKTVDKERYKAAFYRHWLAYLDDPNGVDSDSGYPHLWHAACNIAFLIEMEEYPMPDRVEQ